MTASMISDGVEISVLEAEKAELAAFVRRMVSDSDLRAAFQADPGAALDRADLALSPAVRDAIVAQAPTVLSATSDVDGPMAAVFLVIIIIKSPG